MVRFLTKRQAHRENRSDDLSKSLVTVSDPASGAAEAYRNLRTNLLYARADTSPKVVVVTSPGPMEGKSTTCANLGVVLAQADKNVLLLDCDLRKPTVHKIFALRNVHGIVDVLVGERSLQAVLHEPVPGLHVATAGFLPPNPSELLSSTSLVQLIENTRQEFGYVLIDTPPTEVVSDSAILATQGDGVLLVLDAQNTRRGALRQSVRSLRAVGANILGTVMNNIKGDEREHYFYRPYAYR